MAPHIPSVFLLAAAGVLAGLLVRKLTADANAGVLAAASYVFAPSVRRLAGADPRLAACLMLLPGLMLIFYRTLDLPEDAGKSARRINLACLSAILAFLGILDPRFATSAGLSVWSILFIGLSMDRKRKWRVWGPPLKSWSLACIGGILLYSPLWFWRRGHPYALAKTGARGIDFLSLWIYSPSYIGIAVMIIAAVGFTFSRSYLAQARLWSILAGLMLWARLGPGFFFGGRYFWWVPALDRGLLRLPWLKWVPPDFFAAAGQLALAVAAGYGLIALYARLPIRFLRWRWLRPLLCAALTSVIIADCLVS